MERATDAAIARDARDDPEAWEFDALLTNGRAVFVRPIQQADSAALIGLHAGLARDSIFRLDRSSAGRYLDGAPEHVARLAEVGDPSCMAFVAIAADELIAIASYERTSPAERSAQVAFVVADAYQHQGVATLLFEGLAAYARAEGIERFVAEVMADNADMLGVIGAVGLRSNRTNEGEHASIEIDLRPTARYQATCDEREARAEAASMAAALRPRTIAVVGASRRPGSAGHEIVRSLLAADVAATVYPINPSARSICGVPAYANLSSVPEPIDLAVVAVPADAVRGVFEEAAAVGVRAVSVITAGFAETGRAGAEAERELLSIARRHGMRVFGPNCLGLVNTDPDVRMNATFSGLDPLGGGLALISQSGAVGIVLAERASAAGLGLSSFVSIGNKLDVSSNDLLCFFERDDRTSVIALYLESLGNPRKFARITRRVGETKPIVALKAGKSAAGARGARSHTAAAATPEVTVEALLRGAGVIKVDRLDELLDVSAILLTARLPAGPRVALVGNSGGPLILAADACEGAGLVIPELDEATRAALGAHLVAAAATSNPVDLTADGTAAMLEQALEVVLDVEGIDAVIVVVTDLSTLPARDARAAVDRVARHRSKPIVACVLGDDLAPHAGAAGPAAEVPAPERAAVALAHVCRYARWRSRPRTRADRPSGIVPSATLREIVGAALADGRGGWLELDEGARLLGSCAIPMVSTKAAHDADEAAAVAQELGLPVALKARAGDLVHKSDVGGVVTGLSSPDAVRAAYREMFERLGPDMRGAIVQPMAPPGVEAIVGLVADPLFGPVVMVGLGGVMTDLLGDRAFAVPPLDPGDAEEMIRSLRTSPLLDGYRGTPRVDRAALAAIVEQVASLAEEVPELVELDLNPVIVSEGGALVVDCKARLAPLRPGPGPLFRALRPRARPPV